VYRAYLLGAGRCCGYALSDLQKGSQKCNARRPVLPGSLIAPLDGLEAASLLDEGGAVAPAGHIGMPGRDWMRPIFPETT